MPKPRFTVTTHARTAIAAYPGAAPYNITANTDDYDNLADALLHLLQDVADGDKVTLVARKPKEA